MRYRVNRGKGSGTGPFRATVKGVAAAAACLLLLSCSRPATPDASQRRIVAPENWGDRQETRAQVADHWLATLGSTGLTQLVETALENNQTLQQQALAVEIRKEQLVRAGSALWPSLDLALKRSRSRAVSAPAASDAASVDLNLTYELDIWGKLSADARRANRLLLAEQASYAQARQDLVARVANAWLTVLQADRLLRLFQQRVDNARENQAIIESGYRRGLNSALDVYLVRNELNSQISRVRDQESVKVAALRALERLLGQYPDGRLAVSAGWPVLTEDIPLGMPSDLITRKAGLVASWNRLLAQDAALAFAHKQRFPSLNLTASAGDRGNELDDLLKGSPFAWSLLGSLTTPLFNAGRLRAGEAAAALEVKQAEQAYLDDLYGAFEAVENALTRDDSLRQRYQAMVKAQENAIIAATLSFEQYQKGLVNYTTVLEAQNRSFEAQTTVIQLRKQRIANRVDLHLALGGDFDAAPRTDESTAAEQDVTDKDL